MADAKAKWLGKQGGVALDAGEAGELAGEVLLHAGGVGAHGLEQGPRGAVRLVEQGDGEVLGFDFGIGPVLGQRIGRLERFPGFIGEFIELHGVFALLPLALCKRRAT